MLRVNIVPQHESETQYKAGKCSDKRQSATIYHGHLEDDIPGLAHDVTPIALMQAKITSKQLQCIAWVSQGKSSVDVGALLGISRRTVDGHITILCARLGVRTRVQAVLVMRDLGFLAPVKPKIGAKKRVTLRVVI
jgi:DNA-binding CsgD family transcriptional regulator